MIRAGARLDVSGEKDKRGIPEDHSLSDATMVGTMK